MKVLVLCTGNSCRSQMMEGFVRKHAEELGIHLNVYSAGTAAHGLNPRAVQVMQEIGVDISGYESKTLDRYLHISFDYVITVCDKAKESCPLFPGNAIKIHKDFEDPATAQGSDEGVLAVFRRVRDQIDAYAKSFLEARLAIK